MNMWSTQLKVNGKTLGQVNIRRSVTLGDLLSPLLFVIAITALSHILNKTDLRYQTFKISDKIKHLLYMDYLKLYCKFQFDLFSGIMFGM